jgi:hypothetical protein
MLLPLTHPHGRRSVRIVGPTLTLCQLPNLLPGDETSIHIVWDKASFSSSFSEMMPALAIYKGLHSHTTPSLPLEDAQLPAAQYLFSLTQFSPHKSFSELQQFFLPVVELGSFLTYVCRSYVYVLLQVGRFQTAEALLCG